VTPIASHPPRIGLRTVALAVVCALAAGFPPVLDSASAQNGTDHVLVATTGNQSELRDRVPIGQFAGQKPRVVMSLAPEALPSLSSGDRLKVTAELEVTTDCLDKGTRCVGEPYEYNPIVQTRLILANAPLLAEGAGTLELGAERRKCRQKPPDRAHHCVIVFTDTVLDVADPSQLPCSPGSCFLNMVVDAHNTKKKRGQRNKLLIGEDEPDGTVVRDKGRLNAIRFSPGSQPQVQPQVTNTLLAPFVPVRKGQGVVLFSQELTGLERNDQLTASALFTTSIGTVSYNVLNRTRLVLAPDPTATKPGKDVKDMTEPRGEIAEANGFNCTRRNPLCTTSKVGVITMRRDAEDEAGDPIPLYANVVFDAVKPGSVAPAGDTVQIFPGGNLSVTTYPAAMLG
jgi:hypothetical protein